jgi:hypothetical protein
MKQLKLLSKGSYKETLTITINKKNVSISANIDGVGQDWEIDKVALRNMLC